MSQAQFNGRVTGPRYVIRFTNGTWIIFDRLNFTACEPFGRRIDADKALRG